MSSRSHSQPCSFADIARSYRVYILDDLLAEPQELAHDWARNVLYVSQRYRQGNAFAPIEASHGISVLDVASADTVNAIDLRPYGAPHGLELETAACAYLYVNVDNGAVWVDPDRCVWTNFAPTEQTAPAMPSSNDFIAEIDLRSGRMRQRVNVPQSETPNDGRFVAFSAPAIRFAGRGSGTMPVMNVENDPILEAIKSKFNVRTVYITSRNILLV